ncbi:vWA domain-containing protein [Methylogaea oryzae]|uniref:VWFA domain-containing protein n=2 Tax=Methylogaea oryzae TaxID=1295382 RepID=A0A8D4VML5_9GAMM|nr:vWA domain-containing protein [Methylogaea oryzae]BBL70029.1 hypothetical protein MoryE10_06350 [Methylogaea oryzae]
MNKPWNALSAGRAALISLALLSAARPAAAYETRPLDLVLVLDTAVSMAVSDPRRLAPSAVELLLNLLPAQSRVQVFGFDRDVHTRSELRLLDADGRRDLNWLVQNVVASPHVGSDFRPPLEAALQSLAQDRRENARPIVLLFSDGITNVGSNDENQRQKEAVLRQTVARLHAAGIRVFAIAFSEHVDAPFLQDIAAGTSGLTMVAERTEQLSELFTTIFEIIEQPDMLPVDRVVHVDDHVGSLSLLVNRKPEEADGTVLISPQGDAIDATSARPDIHWTSGRGYSLVTMDHPQQGDWQLQPDSDGSRKAYIVTDVALRVEAPDLVGGGDAMPPINAWLEQAGGGVMNTPGVRIQAGVTALNDSAAPDVALALADDDGDGRFSQTLPKLAPGAYRITVQASVGNLQRIKEHGLTVAAAPPPREPAAGDSETDSLIMLAWINLALLPMVGAAVYLRMRGRKKRRRVRRGAPADE